VDYAKFSVAVIEIAGEGTRLTTANVVSRLRIDPAKAEKMLDQMARDGRLDLEVDESEGVVVYRVRGLTTRVADDGWRSPNESLQSRPGRRDGLAGALRNLGVDPMHVGTALAFGKPFRKSSPLPRSLQRSVPAGVALGGLLPGAGLAYAAPWASAAIATAVVFVGFELLPLLLAIPFLLCAMIVSAVLGGLYTWRYNQTGRRSPLAGEPGSRQLPGRGRALS
jgi:hypothetical protein